MENNKLVRRSSSLTKALSQSLQVSSLDDLLRVKQDSNIFMLLDVSGSMGTRMRKNGKTRIQGLREAVKDIQSEREMKMVQFGFGNEPSFVTSIPDATGGTPLHLAIQFARQNGAGRAIVISDGVPDDKRLALDAAREFGGRIDVIFVGDEGEAGEAFLKILAESTGGESFTGDLSEPKQLAGKVMGLLTAKEDANGDDDDED